MPARTVTVACLCPPKADGSARHEEDTVTLRERLSFRQALAIRNAVRLLYDGDLAPTEGEILATLTEEYIRFGVESWSFVGDDGKPAPVTRYNVQEILLTHDFAAETVGDAADALYQDKVVLPLAQRVSTSSQGSQATDSTSAETESSTEPPTPPSPSSTTTTPTAGTAKTSKSRAGVSKSSPNSGSDA